MDKFWLLSGPASLIERGNALLGDSPIELSIGLLFYDVQVAGRTSHGGGCRCGCRVIPSEELRIKIGERDEALFVARLQFDAGVRQFLGER